MSGTESPKDMLSLTPFHFDALGLFIPESTLEIN